VICFITLSFIGYQSSLLGQHWFKHRRLLTPAFGISILESFCDVFTENSKTLVHELTALSEKTVELDIYPLITKTTLDIICGE
jgi:cytochrome P450 family 4